MIPVLKNDIKVESTKFQDVLLVFLILFFGGTSLVLLADLFRLPQFLVLVPGNLSLLFFICRIVFIMKKKAVRSFKPEGVLRGDWRLISWKDFRGGLRKIRRVASARDTTVAPILFLQTAAKCGLFLSELKIMRKFTALSNIAATRFERLKVAGFLIFP